MQPLANPSLRFPICAWMLSLAGACLAEPGDEYLYLSASMDVDGFSTREVGADGDFDGLGRSYPAGALGDARTTVVRSTRFGSIEFLAPDTRGHAANMLSCRGQTIRVQTRRVFDLLFVLGASHHGDGDGWVDFRLEDGTVTRGPLGLSDWQLPPVFGEEAAFSFASTVVPERGGPPDGKVRLWLQAVPIASGRRVVSIRLPALARTRVLALTLGSREGERQGSEPEAGPDAAEPAPVAIFDEPGFPHGPAAAAIDPEAAEASLRRKGIVSRRLRLERLADPAVLRPDRFPVLVLPHGGAFPSQAEESIRAYRAAGGSIVHCGPPWTTPLRKTSMSTWIPFRGPPEAHGDPSAPGRPGDSRYLGGGTDEVVSEAPLAPSPTLRSWGLGGLPWGEWSACDALGRSVGPRAIVASEAAERIPLLTWGEGEGPPFAAVLRRGGEADPAGGARPAFDVRLSCSALRGATGPVPPEVWVEAAARASAWILREAGLLGEEAWTTATSPLELERRPAEVEGSPARGGGDAALPVGTASPRAIRWVPLAGIAPWERTVLSSAQGLLCRRDEREALFLVETDRDLDRLRGWWGRDGATVSRTDVEGALDLLGHRRAVVFDPGLPGSFHLAAMVAALEGLLVAPPAATAPLRLEVAVDLRGLFADRSQILEWARDHLAPRLEGGALCVVPPDACGSPILDYVVAHPMLAVWLPAIDRGFLRGSRPRRELEIVREILDRYPAGSLVLGDPGEPASGGLGAEDATVFLSAWGHVFVPSRDANVSFSARREAALRLPAPEPRREIALDPGKIYIACAPVAPGGSAAEAWKPITGTAGFEFTPEVPAALSVPPSWPALAPDRLAGLLPGSGACCLGSFGRGLACLETLGDARGAARESVRATCVRAQCDSLKALGAGYLPAETPPPPELLESPWLPLVAVVVGPRGDGARGVDVLRCASLAGSAALFRDPGPTGLLEYIADLKGERIVSRVRPAFIAAVPETLGRLSPATVLEDDVVLVRPDELGDLFRRWASTRRIESRELIAAGSRWRYHDGGRDLGTEWRQPDHDDSGWREGEGELGYGDEKDGRPEKTVVSSGPSPDRRSPTTYFRRALDLADPGPGTAYVLEIVVDDGCVAYLNGMEVARRNMPDGEVSHATWASRAVSGDAEGAWHRIGLGPEAFREGRNVLAVEMHQSDAKSSDLSFDLRLSACGWRETAPP